MTQQWTKCSEQARGLREERDHVDHTTTSPAGTRQRGALGVARRCVSARAGVHGPEERARCDRVMLASGKRARFEALEPALSKMTGKLLYLGKSRSGRRRSSCWAIRS